MYKSPIEMIYGELQTQMEQKNEEMVIKAIREVGVNVDKEELIKALQYDRNQYTKGYKDGKNDVLDKIRTEMADLKNSSLFGAVSNYDLTDVIMEIIDKYKERDDSERLALQRALEIMDKYKESGE